MKIYDLEDQIMNCWNVTKDMEDIYRYVLDFQNLDEDELANLLLGLKNMYEIKFNILFKTYEQVLKSQAIGGNND